MLARKSHDGRRQRDPLNVWVSGFFGRENVGDEALLASVLVNFPEWVSPTVLSSAPPARVQAIHDCRCILEPPFDQRSGKYGLVYGAGFWLKKGVPYWLSRRQNRALIIAGGGLINDHVAGRVVDIRKRVDAIRDGGTNVALLGVGVDPLTVPEDRQAACELFDRVSYCSIRDNGSEQSLLEVGVSPNRFCRGADLAFALPVPGNRVSSPRTDDLRKAMVGLNLRPLFDLDRERGSRKHERRCEYVRECRKLIASLASIVGELVLVPYNPQDVEFLHEVASRTVRILEFTPNPYLSLARMQEFDTMVGMRYHSLIFAVLRNVPLVPLVYGTKAAALAEELGVSWKNLAVGDGTETFDQPLKTEAVLDSLQQVWGSRSDFRARCEELVSRKRNVAIKDITQCVATLSALDRGEACHQK